MHNIIECFDLSKMCKVDISYEVISRVTAFKLILTICQIL